MGEKGVKRTLEADLSQKLLIEKLKQISGITSKKMFGGYGIFHDGKMFGLVNSNGKIYFKSNESIQSQFDASNAVQHGKMPYFSLHEEVFNDIDLLNKWAQKSIEISK